MSKLYSKVRMKSIGLLLGGSLILFSTRIQAQNNCLSFDGIDDFVNVGVQSQSGNYATGFTFMTWIKWGAFNNNSCLFDFGNGAPSNNIILAINGVSNSLKLTNYVGTTAYSITTPNILSLNQWTHVAATISATGNAKIYINGVLVVSGNVSTPSNVSRSSANLGKSNWTANGYLNATLDEMSIFITELPVETIQSYMFSTLTSNENGLWYYFNFDQGEPNCNNASITKLVCYKTIWLSKYLYNFALNGSTSNFISRTDAFNLNNCLAFDGSDDYINCGSINPAIFSVEAWINPSVVNKDMAVFSTLSETALTGSELHINATGNPVFTLREGSSWLDIQSPNSISANSWTHLAATFDGTNASLYVNGVQVATKIVASVITGSSTMMIGKRSSSADYYAFNGKIDECRIWDSARSQSDIATNMYLNPYGTESGLLANYNFNQGIAEGANIGIVTLVNSVGANSATLNNFALLNANTTSNWVRSGYKLKPTSHVSSFEAYFENGELAAQWVDVQGRVVPDGYYIFVSKTNTFSKPVDGVEPIIDNDLSDGSAVVKVSQSTQNYRGWINENLNDDYYLRIYPYNNSGSDIKFLTSDPIPQKQVHFNRVFIESIPASDGNTHWIDYDNDGDLDLFYDANAFDGFAQKSFSLYQHQPDNSFSNLGLFTSPMTTGTSDWGDYDNDGDLDAILSNYSSIAIHTNNNNGTSFSIVPTIMTGSNPLWGDIDNDGDLDVLVSGSYIPFKIYRNDGNNIFNEVLGNNIRPLYGTTNWLDYNNDGLLDVIVCGTDAHDNKFYTAIFKNCGNGKFVEQTDMQFENISVLSVLVTDINNDGYVDLFIAGQTSTYSSVNALYKNNAGKGFSRLTFSNTSSLIFSTAAADFDNDGLMDIICYGNRTANTYDVKIVNVYRNNGDETFSEYDRFTTGKTYYTVFNITDLNNDGNIDFNFQYYNWANGTIKTFQNLQHSINLKPNKVTGAKLSLENCTATFVWDKATDDKTPSNGLTYNLRIGKSSKGDEVLSANSLPTGVRKMLTIGNVGADTAYKMELYPGTYFWSVQAIDNAYKGGEFSNELTFTVDSVPAFNLRASIIDDSSLKLKWNNGNGTRRAVFCKMANSGRSLPINDKTYLGSPFFGEGDQIGTSGWFCVYSGEADSAIINNLTSSNDYMFHVVEYYGKTGSEKYMWKINDTNPFMFSTAPFSDQPSLPSTNIQLSSAIWGDYNNDGFLDILSTKSGSPKLFKNLGNNTFKDTTVSLSGTYRGSMAWFDYNNDGNLDLILAGDQGGYTGGTVGSYCTVTTKVFKNVVNATTKAHTFELQSDIVLPGVYWGSTIACADYNNDGYVDILLCGYYVTGSNTGYPISKIYKNNGPDGDGKYSFSEQTQIQIKGLYNGSAQWGDYNNDGWVDLLITGEDSNFISGWYAGSIYSKVYLNDKNGNLIEQPQIQLDGATQGSCQWIDYDKDGYLDIITSGIYKVVGYQGYGATHLYHNNGDNTFSLVSSSFESLTQPYYPNISLADFDNDNDMDILFGGFTLRPGYKRLFKNDFPLKTFTKHPNFYFSASQLNSSGSDCGTSAWGDYDNDGDMDIISTYTGSNLDMKIERNNAKMVSGNFPINRMPNCPKNLKATLSPGQLHVNWDKVDNDETANLTYNLLLKSGDIILNSPKSNLINGKRLVNEFGNAGLNTFAIFMNLPAGVYEIKVQAIDGAFVGSAWSAPITVDVRDIQAFFTFDEVCRGDSTQFTNQSIPQGSLTWLWKFDDGTTSTEQTPKHKFVASGAHQVWLVITSTELKDANGKFLKDSVMHTINVKPNPKASFTAPNVCQGTETNFTNNTDLDGIAAKLWKWDYGNGESSTGIEPIDKTYGIAKTYKTKLVVVATNDCADSMKVSTIVTPVPSAFIYSTLNSKFEFCNNTNESASLYVAPQDNCTYQWMNNGSRLLDETNPTLTINKNYGSNTYSIKALVKADDSYGGCSSITSNAIEVKVKDSPVAPTILAPLSVTICEEDTVKLSVPLTPNIKYLWSGGLNPNSSNTYNATTSGNYSVSIENSVGCSVESTNKISVTVNSKPSKPVLINSLGATTTICSDKELLLKVDDTPGMTYEWFNGVALLPNATAAQFRVEQSGSYSVRVKNGFNCSNTASPIQITVNQSPTAPSIAYSGSTTFCGGDSLLLTAPPFNGMTYSWLLNGGDLGVTSNELFAKANGSYSVKVKNTLQCEAISAPVSVIVNPSPAVPSVSYGDTEFCQGGSITFSVASINGLFYQWKRSKESITGATSSTYTTQEKGDYWLSITNSSQCSVSTSPVAVTVNDLPAKPAIGEVNGITSFCPETEVTLKVQNASSYLNYQWRRSGINIEGGGNSSYAGKLSAGDYSVVASKGICSAESDIITLNTKQAPVKPTISARGPNVWILVCDNKAANIYKWYYNNQLVPTANTYQYVANKNLGDYKVEVNEGGECSTVSDIINIPTGNVVSGIDELVGEVVSISPNPSSGIFNVDLGMELMGNIDVQILDSKGTLVVNQQLGNASSITINLSNYPSGIYLCRISHKDISITKKIVKI